MKTGDLMICFGGIGKRVGLRYQELCEDMKVTRPTVCVYADSDNNDMSSDDVEDRFHATIPLALTPSQVGTIKANKESFGPGVQAALENDGKYLFKTHEAAKGSRTFRPLTLCTVAFFIGAIIKLIHEATRQLMRQDTVEGVRPIFISSSGGGCGSACQVLFAYIFCHPELKQLIRIGLPECVHEPIVSLMADPFTYILQHQFQHAAKIGANAYATYMEMEMLQHAFSEEESVFNTIHHFGLCNASGQLAERPEDITEIMANCLVEMQNSTHYLDSRLTDLYEVNKLVARYSGSDALDLGLDVAIQNNFVDENLFVDKLKPLAI